jgi:hypothetical protein
MNSLQRYYLNNFQDADRQEGVDLLVGFQPFTEMLNETEPISSVNPPASAFHDRGLSIQEAAHRALLGNYANLETDEDNHVRIKVKRRSRGKVGALAISKRHPSPLELRWLPGDLQTQMRGMLSPNFRTASPLILQSLDSRSSMELPWWATSGSASDDDAGIQNQELADAEMSAMNNPGYLVGAVVAGSQSPLAMATFVLALLITVLSTESLGDYRSPGMPGSYADF